MAALQNNLELELLSTSRRRVESRSHRRLVTEEYENRDTAENDVDDLRGYTSSNESAMPPEKKHLFSIYSVKRVKLVLVVVKLFLFAAVVTCLVYSKLTIIQIFGELHLLSNFSSPIDPLDNSYSPEQLAATLYWMLFFIVMIPNILTCIRSLLNGVLSKSNQRPKPTYFAMFMCVVIAIFEALAETFLIFYGFITLPPTVTLLLMCGVCRIESIFDFFSGIYKNYIASAFSCHRSDCCTQICCNQRQRRNYEPVDSQINSRISACKSSPLANCFILGAGLVFFCIFYFLGMISVGFLLYFAYKEIQISSGFIVINLLMMICIIVLSITWFGKLQKEVLYKPTRIVSPEKVIKNTVNDQKNVTSRWKSNFISSFVRLFIYPFASYLIFRLLYQLQFGDKVDPWAKSNLANLLQWTGHHIHVFAVHIVTSFFGYILSWIACYMTLHVSGLVLPVIVSTPLSLFIYFLSSISYDVSGSIFILYPFQKPDHIHFTEWKDYLLSDFYIGIAIIATFLWICQVIATLSLYKSKNAILASDRNMFVRPYYNSVFLEQSLIINRSVSYSSQQQKIAANGPFTVFICSTMFRETKVEMEQMLTSIKRVGEHYAKKFEEKRKSGEEYNIYESHIFFDGGCREDELSYFAMQLMSLIRGTLGVKLEDCTKRKTPYGYCYKWHVEKLLPFSIHLKDNLKVRNKKRWSQVMYMNYILEYRSGGLDDDELNNTFILTTDADIDFKAQSVDVLLDMLACDPSVGAVCSRTYPLGSGPLYWYQIFDYAIGHWLQKSTEHILGSVLCCPGCFSMFRCSALKDCLATYSSEVSNAMEFLTKDMGEDRWLCTLLVEKGWKLEYCAISSNYTYCPEEFNEFFKQRRRWIPSSIANLWLLVTKGRKITSDNKYISWIFIVYQLIILISTIISPATVILVIASGLHSSFGINSTAVVVTLSIATICYGIICVYTNQKTQLDVAKILTFLFSLIMAVVVAGLIMDTVQNILRSVHIPNITKSEVDKLIYQNKKLPVAETTLYIGLFAIVFLVTALLHFLEGFALFHSLWYLLGLPSGYLLLLIYSAANLNDRSWGTREAKNTSEKSLFTVVQQKAKELIFKIIKKTAKPKKSTATVAEQKPLIIKEVTVTRQHNVEYEYIIKKWLRDNHSEQFYDNFVKEGYTKKLFLAGINEKDLEEIGVEPTGYRYHLLNAIKKLPQSPITTGLPDTVEKWIEDLEFIKEDHYEEKFNAAGYYGKEDVENLVHITKEELTNEIGVTKKAHVNRFLKAIQRLRIRNEDEKRVAEAEIKLDEIKTRANKPLEMEEENFWAELAKDVLEPIPDGLTQANKLHDDLRFLRNYTLIAIFLINLICLILLFVFTFDELSKFGLSANFLGLLFLAVYSVIISVQFVGMLLHRVVTFCHFIARLEKDPEQRSETEMGNAI